MKMHLVIERKGLVMRGKAGDFEHFEPSLGSERGRRGKRTGLLYFFIVCFIVWQKKVYLVIERYRKSPVMQGE